MLLKIDLKCLKLILFYMFITLHYYCKAKSNKNFSIQILLRQYYIPFFNLYYGFLAFFLRFLVVLKVPKTQSNHSST
jgi:hypothetical protein